MRRRRVARIWQHRVTPYQFADAFGFPREDAEHLSTVFTDIFGMEAMFIKRLAENESEHWTRHCTRRRLLRRLHLLGDPSRLVNVRVHSYDNAVELRFISG